MANDEETQIGSNCVPNFKVKNLKNKHKRIKQFASTIDDVIQNCGDVKLSQFKDSEGNLLEIYERV